MRRKGRASVPRRGIGTALSLAYLLPPSIVQSTADELLLAGLILAAMVVCPTGARGSSESDPVHRAIARRVILPTAAPGLFTAVLLAVARGAGESAPLIFTAIGSQYFSVSPTGPMAAMPLTIYLDGIQAYPTLQRIAWGTGLLLLVFVFVLAVSGHFAAARLGRRG